VQIKEDVVVVLHNTKTDTKKKINSKGVIEKEKTFTTDSVFVLEEDTILCTNCGKPRHQHKECDYHAEVGGPCDCSKFEH